MKYFLFISFFLSFSIGIAQVTTNPEFPQQTQAVKIIFDASKGNAGLEGFTGDVYAHTGVITDKSTSSSDWKYVVAAWGVNTQKAKLTYKGDNIFELEISPDVRSYYGVPDSETILKMAFVFRSADNSKTGRASGGADIFIELHEGEFDFQITSPERITIANKNENINFSAAASSTANLTLFANQQEITSTSGTSLNYTFNYAQSGNYWLKAIATTNDTSIADSVFLHIKADEIIETLPSDYNDGIQYPNNTTARLVLYAPGKTDVFVLGDFNNWLPKNNSRMKKDGDRFWIDIENLSPSVEYAFQYLVDGNIWIADPYTEKILDPWDDKWISETTYPNLKPFPGEYTSTRVSILQTDPEGYEWQTNNYPIPKKEDLVIYELLIRDFTDEQSYKSVMDTLGYLKKLGVNAIEFMPFNEFEGNNSWGYNPNFYFAPDKAYGTKNDLKKLIDKCHELGFVVIQDIVLNHAYNSCPLVKLYWDGTNNRPAADNPWFNTTSPNPVFAWGSDFNHESQATKDFVDRVVKFWLEEYKIDGFRFDFTKGFTNTPGDGSGYDAARIAILKRIADKIWSLNPNAFVILEHFAADSEERELVSYNNGMLVWGNANYNFSEAAMGYHDSGKSNFSRASYQNRGFSQPGLVAYMESHDEERQLYKTKTYGNSSGSYNTKTLETALDRSKLAATFFLSLTGPKMIWQFGELGYDYSINTCENGSISDECRTSPKEVRWDYYPSSDRKKLWNVYAGMIYLREKFKVLTSGNETLNLSSELKSIHLSKSDTNIVVLGNFGIVQGAINPNFQHSGVWYEYFTGTEYNVASVTSAIDLQPGEYRLYSDKALPDFSIVTSSVDFINSNLNWKIYPNPASDQVNIESGKPLKKIRICSLAGNFVFEKDFQNINQTNISTKVLKRGVYIVQIIHDNGTETQKIILK